jgi:Flp pilus assembly pilin Flp
MRTRFNRSGDTRAERPADHRPTEQLGGAATPIDQGGYSSVARQPSAFYRSIENALRIRDERGQTMSEYAVILTVITATVVATVGLLATHIASKIGDIASLIP